MLESYFLGLKQAVSTIKRSLFPSNILKENEKSDG